MALSAEGLSLRGRAGAHALHSMYDSRELTAKARAKAFERFLDEVDPDRVLPESERLRRAEHARRSYMAKLALRSVRARQARKAGRAKFLAEVDATTPGLPEAERLRRAEHLLRAHMKRLALRSSRARKAGGGRA